ncbi:MAG: hypothetical protein K2X32_12880 [Phycisphaerales bacterium]|nr:hypothetical protein [Phycisphaerales bacterium]
MPTRVLSVAMCIAALSAVAQGSVVQTGTYQLFNHPDGSQSPPPYGLRIDELFNATSGHDVYSFTFDTNGAYMRMDYTGSTIRIYGAAYGGRDVGSTWAVEATTGLYAIDFTYNIGVGLAAGDDDVAVNANRQNFGTITAPGGQIINLTNQADSSGLSFRFGDENNDLGHRGFSGLSGWGWLAIVNANGSVSHVNAQDWLFVARIPAPSAGAMLALAALGASRRRRA